jgi:hypothetical protein
MFNGSWDENPLNGRYQQIVTVDSQARCLRRWNLVMLEKHVGFLSRADFHGLNSRLRRLNVPCGGGDHSIVGCSVTFRIFCRRLIYICLSAFFALFWVTVIFVVPHQPSPGNFISIISRFYRDVGIQYCTWRCTTSDSNSALKFLKKMSKNSWIWGEEEFIPLLFMTNQF